MEAARLGLSEYHAVGRVAGSSLALPVDPWLSPPLLSALPGFLAHPQTGYPSYLTSPVGPPHVAHHPPPPQPPAQPPGDPVTPPPQVASPPQQTPGVVADPRSSSIAALRLKAKEHVELLTKGLQMV